MYNIARFRNLIKNLAGMALYRSIYASAFSQAYCKGEFRMENILFLSGFDATYLFVHSNVSQIYTISLFGLVDVVWITSPTRKFVIVISQKLTSLMKIFLLFLLSRMHPGNHLNNCVVRPA